MLLMVHSGESLTLLRARPLMRSSAARMQTAEKTQQSGLGSIIVQQHNAECATAASTYATLSPDWAASVQEHTSWDTFSLPPQVMVSPGNEPYRTDRLLCKSSGPLVGEEDCAAFIGMTEEHGAAHGWHKRYPIDGFTREVSVNDMPAATALLNRLLSSTLLPAVGEQFPHIDASQLRVTTALVVKYDEASGHNCLPTHQDHSLFTLNVALSEPASYDGGGTRAGAMCTGAMHAG